MNLAGQPNVPARSRVATLLLFTLIAVWAVEILCIQHLTTSPGDMLPADQLFKDGSRRMLLNLAAVTCLVALLGRFALYGIFAVGVLCTNILFVYAGYFGGPLTWPTISNQWREGAAVIDHGVAMVSWPVIATLTVALLFKIVLRECCERYPSSPIRRRRIGLIAGGVYLFASIGYAGFYKPIERISTGTPEYVYGYVVAWAAEAATFDHDAILAEALAVAAERSDLITRRETRLAFPGHIAIVQVESLDFAALDARVAGEPVMPFLHRLTEEAMLFKVKPYHETGSSEADFSLLTASAPNGRIVPYKVYGFPYDNSLPAWARQRGFRTVALHGNTGAFFQRRPAYEQMQFDELLFAEELAPQGIEYERDDALLQHSAKLLRTADKPTLHFVITITSHGPFDRIPQSERELFHAQTDLRQAYCNSMRYVDRALEAYYEQLPDDTTLVLYGDHESGVSGYAGNDGYAHVPWMIVQKGAAVPLAHQQRTRSQLAIRGEINQLDMVCYLRDCLDTPTSLAHHPATLSTQTE